MRKDLTIRGIDLDAVALLEELRDAERRQTGAIIGDAIRHYYDWIIADGDVEGADH